MVKKIEIDLNSPKTKKKLMIVGAVIIAVIVGFAYFVVSGYGGVFSTDDEPVVESQSKAAETESEEAVSASSIYVDITGAVKKPSVIMIAEGSRIFEAIEAAGGLTKDANLTDINRAEVLEDGAYLYIPTNKEIKEQTSDSSGNSSGTTGGSTGTSAANSNQSKININTADSATLQQLNGVGPATADKIIMYRETSGKFKKIEDIKNVSGIGDKTFEKLSPFIRV